jgi:hypothetical protein
MTAGCVELRAVRILRAGGTILLCAVAANSARAIDLELVRIDGRAFQGRLSALAPNVVLDTASESVSLAWSDVLGLRPLNLAVPAQPERPPAPVRLELADGSSFYCDVTAATQRDFSVRLPGGQTCTVEFAAVRAIHGSAATDASRRALAEAAADAQAATDVAIVAKGQEVVVLRGSMRGVTAEHVLFAWNAREVPIPWARLAGVILARPTPRGASALVTLHTGEVFAGRVAGGDENEIELQSAVFRDLKLGWDQIARIDCRSERVRFVSDLKPLRYEFEPMFDRKWPYAFDATPQGRPITLGGRPFGKGVVMHSRAQLWFRLDREYQQFAALAGVLDEVGARGAVTLRVLGDGRLLWEQRGVRGGQTPREVLVRVAGVEELVLQVDFDEDLDLGDHAAWAFARLIK